MVFATYVQSETLKDGAYRVGSLFCHRACDTSVVGDLSQSGVVGASNHAGLSRAGVCARMPAPGLSAHTDEYPGRLPVFATDEALGHFRTTGWNVAQWREQKCVMIEPKCSHERTV